MPCVASTYSRRNNSRSAPSILKIHSLQATSERDSDAGWQAAAASNDSRALATALLLDSPLRPARLDAHERAQHGLAKIEIKSR